MAGKIMPVSDNKPLKPLVKLNPDNPHHRVQLDPLQLGRSDLAYAVVNKEHAGLTNTADWWLRSKLMPGAGSTTGISAERVDVVLPGQACDRFSDPEVLAAEVDAAALPNRPALLTYLTIYPHEDRLHRIWELGRALALEIARSRSLASIVVLHAPHRAGSSNPPHVHLLIPPRKIGSFGLADYDHAMSFERGQKIVLDLWAAVKAAYG